MKTDMTISIEPAMSDGRMMRRAIQSALNQIGGEWRDQQLRTAFTNVMGRAPYDRFELFSFTQFLTTRQKR